MVLVDLSLFVGLAVGPTATSRVATENSVIMDVDMESDTERQREVERLPWTLGSSITSSSNQAPPRLNLSKFSLFFCFCLPLSYLLKLINTSMLDHESRRPAPSSITDQYRRRLRLLSERQNTFAYLDSG